MNKMEEQWRMTTDTSLRPPYGHAHVWYMHTTQLHHHTYNMHMHMYLTHTCTHTYTHTQEKEKGKKILCLFKIPMTFFTVGGKKNPKICPKKQKTQTAKAVLSRILEVSHYLTSNKTTVIETKTE